MPGAPLARPILTPDDLAVVRRTIDGLLRSQAPELLQAVAATSRMLAEISRLQALLGEAHSALATLRHEMAVLACDASSLSLDLAFRASDLATLAGQVLQHHGIALYSGDAPPPLAGVPSSAGGPTEGAVAPSS